jgi:hypothetical protein
MVKGYRVTVIAGRYVGRWWAARSSKPVGGMRNSPGGFDSHVPPPYYYNVEKKYGKNPYSMLIN